MPEGHSIHRLAQQFHDTFLKSELRVSSPQGRFKDGAEILTGRRMVRSYAHGKHLFLEFEHEVTLNVHLGIYGAWTFGGDEYFVGASSIGAPRKVGEKEVARASGEASTYMGAPAPSPTVRVRLESSHGWADLVGPTVCRVLNPDEVAKVRAALGPDPLNEDAKPHQFYAALSRTSRPIAAVLMDQKIISGVGNIFRAESLFRRKIDPMTPAKNLTAQQAKGLWDDEATLMQRGVRLGKIVTTESVDRSGISLEEAWPDHAYYVYQRQGEECLHCRGQIAVKELAGRKLYWCTGCQI